MANTGRRTAGLVGLAVGLGLAAVRAADPPAKPKTDPGRVRDGLRALAAGKGDWSKLTVTYDDLHPLHGGLVLTIRGTGRVEQKAVGKTAAEPKAEVTREDLVGLVEVLIAQAAWEQKVPDREPREDESKAALTVTYDGHAVTVWEWYNDLAQNDRLVKVRERMKKAAWKSVGKD